jgi:hypothetical protein
MKTKIAITVIILLLQVLNTVGQTLVSKTLIGSFTKSQLDSMLLARLGPGAAVFTTKFGVDAYKLIYKTFDFDSSISIASGLLAVPQNVQCNFRMVNYSHGTTSVKEDVPSRLNGEGLVGLVAASNGMVICEPDYFGMGDGTWPHYYLHAFTHAMTNIDLLRATREACQDLGISLSNELYLAGYSQGGYSTMVTHQYIETYFPNEFTVTRSFPGAGSYDMSGAMVDLMLSDLDYPSPAYLPFLIFTWNPIYQLFSNPSDYLKSPYDTVLPSKINGLYSIGQINSYMPDTPKLIFHQHVIDSFVNNLNHPFRKALKENDVYKWVPQSPMTMIHCRADRQVPIENTRNAYNYFIQHGAQNVDTLDLNPSLGHGNCGQLYLLYLKNYLDNITGNDTCLTSAIRDIESEVQTELYPNPASSVVTLHFNNYTAKESQIIVSDLNGKKWIQLSLNDKKQTASIQIDTRKLPEGLYLIGIVSEQGIATKKLAVTR